MKKILSFIIGMLTLSACYAQSDYDFSAPTIDGFMLYYKITDAVNHKVTVVKDPLKSGFYSGGYSINGRLEIPGKVEHGGITYTVAAIQMWLFFGNGNNITELVLHEGLETIGYTTFWQMNLGNSELIIPSTVTSYGNGAFYQTWWTAPSVTVRLLNPIPTPNGDNPCFNMSAISWGGLATPKNFRLFVPVDATYAYCNETTPGSGAGYSWSSYKDHYREEVKIGPHGYTSYYLENENFEVPTGCTAYIIKGVTPANARRGDAVVEAFPAGSVIPKQTGFILGGPANSAVAYRANITGATEVDVTGNLLVGTATEREFSETGYKFYLFGHGSQGQGFYHQTGRSDSSIKLKAHRAGLRLSTSDFAPAKELIFDFEAARLGTTTDIQSIQSPAIETSSDAVFDLQGRRVSNPTHGIYIKNGKKLIIK